MKRKKKNQINQFTEALMCWVFFPEWFALLYFNREGKETSAHLCVYGDGCFASTLFKSVSMNHISRITGLLLLSLYANRDNWFINWWRNNSFKKGVNMPTFYFLSTRPGWPLVSDTNKINTLTNWALAAEMKPKWNGYQPKIYIASFLVCLSPCTNSCSLNLSGRSWTVHTL